MLTLWQGLSLLGVAAFCYVVWFLYDLTWVKPRAFLHFFQQQGIQGEFKWLVGQLPEVRRAADEDRIIEMGVERCVRLGRTNVMLAGFIPQLNIQDPELLREVFGRKAHLYHKSSDTLKELFRPLLKNGLLLSEDDHWKSQRGLVSPAFHFHNLRDMLPLISQITLEAFDKWYKKLEEVTLGGSGSMTVDIAREMSKLTLNIVSTAAFGSGFHDRADKADLFCTSLKQVLDAIQQRSLDLTGFIPIVKHLPLSSKRAIDAGCAAIDGIVAEIIRDRRSGNSHAIGGRRDLLDFLLAARDTEGNSMDEQALLDESVTFIAAGAETTSNLIGWLLYRLCCNPHIMAQCVDEAERVLGGSVPTPESLAKLKFIEAVAYEALRLHPPAPILPKYAIQDHEINGLRIPAGTVITINANAVHRDPHYWEDPNAFKPSRFLSQDNDDDDKAAAELPSPMPQSPKSPKSPLSPLSPASRIKQHPFAFLGFSAGPRKCIGKNLAMLEIKTIVAMLLQRFSMKLVPGQKIQADAITRLPKYGILVELHPRSDFDLSRPPSMMTNEERRIDDNTTVLKPVGMI